MNLSSMTNEYEKFIKSAYNKVDKKIEIQDSNNEFRDHVNKWDFFNYDETSKKIDNIDLGIVSDPGKIFLYELVEKGTNNNSILYYPKIGIFANCIPCDQTVELEFFNYRRNWEFNKKYDEKYLFGYLPTQIQNIVLWNDDILIYGVWDSLPNWKILKKYYERTWWYKKTIQQKRNIIITQIQNG